MQPGSGEENLAVEVSREDNAKGSVYKFSIWGLTIVTVFGFLAFVVWMGTIGL